MEQGQAVTTLRLHPWMRTNSSEEAKKLECKAFTYNVLSKITFAAIAAICFSVLLISFALGSGAGTLSYVLVGLVLITPFLAIASSKLQAKGKDFAELARCERSVANQYKAIGNWTDQQIRNYLEEKGAIPNPQIPLRSYLPVIARFEFQDKEAKELLQNAEKLLKAEDYNGMNPELRYFDEKELRTMRISARSIGWQKFEGEAIPAALNAAVVLHVLLNPTLQTTLSHLGHFKIKSYSERKLDRKYGPDDHYFIFRNRGAPLTLREINNDPTPQALRAKLFPAEIG